MAPSMAAVLRAPKKKYVFWGGFFYVLDVVSITVYDRHMLLNIGSAIAQCKPDFEFLNAGALFTDMASEPFVWTARPIWPRRKNRSRKSGKRAGVLVRLKRRAFQPPLPTILLANVQSLDNKLCELRARISYQRETRDCCVICLDVCNGSRLSHRAHRLLRASLGQNERAHREEQRWGHLFLYQQLVVWWKEPTLLNPSAPLIWNLMCFRVDHSGYRGNLQRS